MKCDSRRQLSVIDLALACENDIARHAREADEAIIEALRAIHTAFRQLAPDGAAAVAQYVMARWGSKEPE
jgi:hypothetical protein